ncbi:MAG TPA: hypothetical protein VLL52_20780 [Anaerolineae bacterium]|nr:hypothetical protein [Anaerolineae bacterium]
MIIITILPLGLTQAAPPTAVDLIYFIATGSNNGIALEWKTGSETDTAGFNVKRAASSNPTTPPNISNFTLLQNIGSGGFIPAEGSPTDSQIYQATDTTATLGTGYWYLLVEIETDSTQINHDIVYAVAGATPTPTPQIILTNTPGPTNTPLPTNTPRPTNTPSPTNTPPPNTTSTFTPVPSNTPIPTNTPTPSRTPSATNTPSFTGQTTQPTATLFAFPTSTPIPSNTPLPTNTPSTTGEDTSNQTANTPTPPSTDNATPVADNNNQTAYPDAAATITTPTTNGNGSPIGGYQTTNSENNETNPDDTPGNTIIIWLGFIGALLIFVGGGLGTLYLFNRDRMTNNQTNEGS